MDLSFKKSGSPRLSATLQSVIHTKKSSVSVQPQAHQFSSFTSHKLQALKRYSNGARVLNTVSQNSPQALRKPHSPQVLPTRFAGTETLADHINAEMIRPNRQVFFAAVALVALVVLSTAFLRGDFLTKPPISQSFAREQKAQTGDESGTLAAAKQYSSDQIVAIHQKIIAALTVKDKASSYLLPKPDVSKPAFLQLKELGKTIDLDLENKQQTPSVRFYEFAGTPGDGGKTIMLSLTGDLDATLLKLSPGSKIIINGQDKNGVSYNWTYSMTARNQMNLDDKTAFSVSNKSNLGFVVYAGENSMQMIDARLVSVDKAQ